MPKQMSRAWPVSKRVNSSKAPADDPTLIDPVIQTRVAAKNPPSWTFPA
jgi:hypothetical protein